MPRKSSRRSRIVTVDSATLGVFAALDKLRFSKLSRQCQYERRRVRSPNPTPFRLRWLMPFDTQPIRLIKPRTNNENLTQSNYGNIRWHQSS